MERRVEGFDLDSVRSISDLMVKYRGIGIQATNLSIADELLERMIDEKVTFFFSFTSTVISSGLREIAAQFIRDAKPDAIITTVGAIEEDVMKSFGNFYIGSFNVNDSMLRKKGINRIGNIFVPNGRYEEFESFVRPILESFGDAVISPSELITALSSRIEDKNSFLLACADSRAKVFCPAITDGALGIQLYMHKQRHPKFSVDATADMKELANIVLSANKTGALILGGGMIKHHTIGVNLLREGLDYAVYISSGTEQDASISSAFPREGISWGKVRADSKHAFVWGDYSMLFPLLALSLHEKLKK